MLITALPFAAISASQDQANDQTRRLIRQIMLEQRIPGLQVAVIKDGQIVLSEAYGLANVENGVLASRHPLSAQFGHQGVHRRGHRAAGQQGDWIWMPQPRAI
jgi:CubicO group peptidase (beta-lactamase class C family)